MSKTTLTLDSFVTTLAAQQLVERGTRLCVARAPGRLDVMGGIADYSGSLVLQRPIAEGTFAAVQRSERGSIDVVSSGRAPVSIPLERLRRSQAESGRAGRPASVASVTYDEARASFAANRDQHWASYIAGPLLVLMRERGLTFDGGVRIVVASDVPEGKGVSSSAAVETAVMTALIDAFELSVEARDVALLSQLAENVVAGAPCGVMDQMTCVFGKKDALLALLCQPAELQPHVALPSDLTLWGIDSGERHAVGGSDYTAVRTGTFMGYRMLRARADVPRDYLANVTPEQFRRELERLLPEEMTGAEFLAVYGSTTDVVTAVDPSRTYKVRTPTSHPIYEHDRVKTFRRLLPSSGEAGRRLLGELMYQSHASYSACGLGSPGTDRLVTLVRKEGTAGGLYGARITGGGSGGTVAVLGRADAAAAIDRVASAYEAASGHRPHIFSGSSSGVASFGAVRLNL